MSVKGWTAQLNDKGKREVGHIFPDGAVPIRSPLPSEVHNGDYHGEAYLCDWKRLSAEQQKKLRKLLTGRREIPPEVLDQVLEQTDYAVPIRTALVWPVGIDMRFLT